MRRTLKIAGRLIAIIVAIPVVLVLVFGFVQPPISALMVWRLAGGAGVDHRPVSYDAIAEALPHAVLTSEDNRYCAHHGVDWDAVETAIDEARDGDRLRGASTITMQTAKNLFLWPERSFVRKALEAPLALLIDTVWSKRRILEVYLNIVEWAPGVYGAEAAARHHFGRSAARLTRQQAAQLAAALPAPLVRSAGRPGPVTRRATRRILARMRNTRGLFPCLVQDRP